MVVSQPSTAASAGKVGLYLEHGVGENFTEDPETRVDWEYGRRLTATGRTGIVEELEANVEARHENQRSISEPFFHLKLSWWLRSLSKEERRRKLKELRERFGIEGEDARKIDLAKYIEGDHPSVGEMVETANRLLEGIGLGRHRAWVVAHKDTDVEHLHVLACRLHPATLKLWSDLRSIQRANQVLRKIEREKGWATPAQGISLARDGYARAPTVKELMEMQSAEGGDRGLVSLAGVSLAGGGGVGEGSRKEKTVIAGEFFRARLVKNIGRALEEAKSWEQIERFLAGEAAWLEPRKSGFVVKGGPGKHVKLSSLSPLLSRQKLERRFGETWRNYSGEHLFSKNSPAGAEIEKTNRFTFSGASPTLENARKAGDKKASRLFSPETKSLVAEVVEPRIDPERRPPPSPEEAKRGQGRVYEPAMTEPEMRMYEDPRAYRRDLRITIGARIDSCLKGGVTVSEFIDLMEKSGQVKVVPNFMGGHLSGLSYQFKGHQFKGETIGAIYDLGGLRDRGLDYDPERDNGRIKEALGYPGGKSPRERAAEKAAADLPDPDPEREEVMRAARKARKERQGVLGEDSGSSSPEQSEEAFSREEEAREEETLEEETPSAARREASRGTVAPVDGPDAIEELRSELPSLFLYKLARASEDLREALESGSREKLTQAAEAHGLAVRVGPKDARLSAKGAGEDSAEVSGRLLKRAYRQGFGQFSVGYPEKRELQALWFAASFYRDNYRRLAEDHPAKRYVREKRGFSDETAQVFGFGYAPDSYRLLRRTANRAGFSDETLKRAGLISEQRKITDAERELRALRSRHERLENKKGQEAEEVKEKIEGKKRQLEKLRQKYDEDGIRFYDDFRSRLMFPIRGPGGNVRGFGARQIEGFDPEIGPGGGKYRNSTDSPVFDKGSLIYGITEARESIRRQGEAILVEGYLDVAALREHGIENAVGAISSTVGEKRAQALAREGARVIVALDGGERDATLSALENLTERGVRVRAVDLPEGKDPEDLARERGGKGFQSFVRENAKTHAEYALSLALGEEGFNSEVIETQKSLVRSIGEAPRREQERLVREFADAWVRSGDARSEADARREVRAFVRNELIENEGYDESELAFGEEPASLEDAPSASREAGREAGRAEAGSGGGSGEIEIAKGEIQVERETESAAAEPPSSSPPSPEGGGAQAERKEKEAGEDPLPGKIEVLFDHWSKKDARENPERIFVFGDNEERKGTKNQASVRGEPNAIGVATKKAPRRDEAAYYDDSELERNIRAIEKDLRRVEEALRRGRTVVFSSGGLGTGLSDLPSRAPETYKYLRKRLSEISRRCEEVSYVKDFSEPEKGASAPEKAPAEETPVPSYGEPSAEEETASLSGPAGRARESLGEESELLAEFEAAAQDFQKAREEVREALRERARAEGLSRQRAALRREQRLLHEQMSEGRSEAEQKEIEALRRNRDTARFMLKREFQHVYKTPSEAVNKFEKAVEQAGPERAIELLESRPKAFGGFRGRGFDLKLLRLRSPALKEAENKASAISTKEAAGRFAAVAAAGYAVESARLTEKQRASLRDSIEVESRALAETIPKIFRDPESAYQNVRSIVEADGAFDAAEILKRAPSRVGRLRGERSEAGPEEEQAPPPEKESTPTESGDRVVAESAKQEAIESLRRLAELRDRRSRHRQAVSAEGREMFESVRKVYREQFGRELPRRLDMFETEVRRESAAMRERFREIAERLKELPPSPALAERIDAANERASEAEAAREEMRRRKRRVASKIKRELPPSLLPPGVAEAAEEEPEPQKEEEAPRPSELSLEGNGREASPARDSPAREAPSIKEAPSTREASFSEEASPAGREAEPEERGGIGPEGENEKTPQEDRSAGGLDRKRG